ncbi:MAG: hypothetical protein LC808_33030 [Actinobacteria bacterium]|nr:hypothetical protein [Actinomycetota bacterium]
MTGTGPVPALRGQQREQIAAALAHRFVQEQVSIRDLASELGRRPSLIRRLLDEAGVCADTTSCVGVAESEIATVLAARYRDGVPIEQLSDDTGIDRRVIRRLLTEAGVSRPERHPLPVDQSDWVVEQYRAGVSLRELAKQTSCSYSTIRRVLLQAGVALRSSGTTRSSSPGE